MTSIFPSPAPTLPEFSTLLVKGDYHPSAPIHLALSYVHAHDADKVLILTPSRARFTAEIKQVKDRFLVDRGGTGRVAKASRKVEMLYPPTPSHLELLLSLFHEALTDGKDFLHQKTTFSVTPSLIVLCEPSAYFLETHQATVSSYLTVVSECLSLINSLSAQSGKPVALALFDSNLDNLRLPILKPQETPMGPSGKDSTRIGVRQESVAELAQRYFQWTGTVVQDIGGNECTFHLARSRIGEATHSEEDIVWRWRRIVGPDGRLSYAFHLGGEPNIE